ncbi:Negative cofactor 2 complex subunit beta [Lachnellula willkommii]|uniref:NCT transcriptional regulatory complex subunit B n=1 Tax=Lachnellula willkommii TaxID=215461 RepID=A0A559MBY9_9HELO|nr:Negative cofactor 2 complex subunit beta [Lachnellula willkommii]
MSLNRNPNESQNLNSSRLGAHGVQPDNHASNRAVRGGPSLGANGCRSNRPEPFVTSSCQMGQKEKFAQVERAASFEDTDEFLSSDPNYRFSSATPLSKNEMKTCKEDHERHKLIWKTHIETRKTESRLNYTGSNFLTLSLLSFHDLSKPRVLIIISVATVQKIVTEILPPSSGLAFGKDARDLLIECCVEFITLISSEANEISEKESKKTIACEHITKALEQLGFGDYVQDIMEVASEHKEQLKGREKKVNKLEQSGLSTEQLLAMQEEAFRDAAQRHG